MGFGGCGSQALLLHSLSSCGHGLSCPMACGSSRTRVELVSSARQILHHWTTRAALQCFTGKYQTKDDCNWHLHFQTVQCFLCAFPCNARVCVLFMAENITTKTIVLALSTTTDGAVSLGTLVVKGPFCHDWGTGLSPGVNSADGKQG